MDIKEIDTKRMIILPITKKWFEMLKSGEKAEEYREIKPYYTVRFLKGLGFPKTEQDIILELLREKEAKKPITVLFRNGYSKASPSFMAECYLSIGRGKEKWGAAPGGDYFVLRVAGIHPYQT